ncbi:amidohydrolase family protein [Roseobacter sinensis]|uniref:Amidohydrolase family protein n=1 Tax=Roseobacter sinensis TaxID=2931391 RepID=A0ABT3BIP9_9RHOB|nr:amidohydrolase family protein [Roseobacter sp. WL0113]MCV3273445.1 amidohydrolase family protein [Roseobacter sp. WL0113]
MSAQIITARWIVTGTDDDGQTRTLDDAALVHDAGAILAVGPADEIRQAYPQAQVTSYPRHLIMPGLVNAHHHIGLTPLQMGAPDSPLEHWFAARLAMRKIDPYLDTLYSAFEMIASGVTTVQHIQGWAVGNIDAVTGSAEEVLRAYDDIGMRVSYCYSVREQNRFVYEADEAFCNRLPPEVGRAMAAHLARVTMPFDDFMALFDRLMETRRSARARIQLAPANLHWMTDDGLLAMQEKSAAAGVPMHMHLLETAYQKEYAFRRTGTTAVRHLERLGLLGPHMTLGHGVWMTEEDVEICAGTGTCICHNCSSNLRLRSGVLPLMALVQRGMTVGLGIDEAGINDDRDMLQEMRMALNLHRFPGMDPADVPSPGQILRMATEHGARTTAFGAEIGRLEPGRRLDAVVFDYDRATYPYQDPDIAPADALIHRAKSKDVHQVIVEGEVILEDGRFIRIDRDAVLTRIAEALSQPRDEDEVNRHSLRDAVFPTVKAFYDGYLRKTADRTPFYKTSSRR